MFSGVTCRWRGSMDSTSAVRLGSVFFPWAAMAQPLPSAILPSAGGGEASGIDTAKLLVEYQTIMAMVSDMQLGSICEGLALPPSMPMHGFAAFNSERLARVSRWKATGSSKDIIRAYAKVVQSLAELSVASQHINIRRPQGIGKAKTAPVPCAEPLALSGPSEKPQPATHAVLSRFEVAPGARLGGKMLALPAKVWRVIQSWTSAAHWTTEFLLVVATWVPIVAIFVGVVILICDSSLLLSLLWRALAVIPLFVRSSLHGDGPAQGYSSGPRVARVHPEFAQQSYFEPPARPVPQFAHPGYAVPTPDNTLLYMNLELGALGSAYVLLGHYGLLS